MNAMLLQKCPHCRADVLFLNTTCPRCSQPSSNDERLPATPELREAEEKRQQAEHERQFAQQEATKHRFIAAAYLLAALLCCGVARFLYTQPLGEKFIGAGTVTSASLQNRDLTGLNYDLLNGMGSQFGEMAKSGRDRLSQQQTFFMLACVVAGLLGLLFLYYALLGLPRRQRSVPSC